MERKIDALDIRATALQKSFDYATFLRMLDHLVRNGETSGENQSDELVKYTKLNASRVKRLTRTAMPSPSTVALVKSLPFDMEWVVISEAWCGDVAQNLPFINNLAEACPNVRLRMVFRDENPEYMDRFLTNGARSIPKWVIYRKDTDEILAVWGPQPAVLRKMVLDMKSGENPPSKEFIAEEVHRWYHNDRNSELEKEIAGIFGKIAEEHGAEDELTR